MTFVRVFTVLFAVLLLAACANPRIPGPGLQEGRLAPCPSSPRCVNSDSGNRDVYVEPLQVGGKSPEWVWAALERSIHEMGGRIVLEKGDYLAATFVSSVMGFVDDLECRYDREAGLVYLRSSSRIGYYDFEVNRKRVQALRSLVAQRLIR